METCPLRSPLRTISWTDGLTRRLRPQTELIVSPRVTASSVRASSRS